MGNDESYTGIVAVIKPFQTSAPMLIYVSNESSFTTRVNLICFCLLSLFVIRLESKVCIDKSILHAIFEEIFSGCKVGRYKDFRLYTQWKLP
jgi:hypothetical protein